MYREEIGGEFWNPGIVGSQSKEIALNYQGNLRYYLSGRTALEAIILDILFTKDCKTAYLPSYCCHTMIEPFLKHGLSVDFYDVIATKGGIKPLIDDNHSCDIVLFMNYFGYRMEIPNLPKLAIVIDDITHRLSEEVPSNVNYAYASFRKWEAVAAASVASKLNENWNATNPIKGNDKYIKLRNAAYIQKQLFMNKDTNDKDIFLKQFADAEKLLEEDYSGYSADEVSIQTSNHISYGYHQRKENARFLLENTCFNKNILPVFTKVDEEDTPLYFPILVKEGKRDALRNHLIEHRVYCPVHWPITDMHKILEHSKTLFDEELSLICDQRYTVEDMARITDLLNNFF